jgi:hypothetical protein
MLFLVTEKEEEDMIYSRFLSKRCEAAAANAIARNTKAIHGDTS